MNSLTERNPEEKKLFEKLKRKYNFFFNLRLTSCESGFLFPLNTQGEEIIYIVFRIRPTALITQFKDSSFQIETVATTQVLHIYFQYFQKQKF